MKNLTLMTRQRNRAPFRTGNRKAAAMVECAVTLPLLIVMVLGILEIGAALRASSILQSACRESGRLTGLSAMDLKYIIKDNRTRNQKIEQDLKNFLTAAGLRGNNSTVTITHACGASVGQTFNLADPLNDLQLVKVEVTMPYSSVSAFPMTYLGGKTLKESIVMRAVKQG